MGKIMIFIAFLMLFSACTKPEEAVNEDEKIFGINSLLLDADDLKEMEISTEKIDCKTEQYETGEFSPIAQYSFCNFTADRGSNFVLEFTKFTNMNDLNGSYQYNSAHLFGAKGFMPHDTFGDQSKFHVNNEDDYGAEFNEPGVFFYHLWFTKEEYLIHITSKGAEEDKEDIAKMGREILTRFK